MAFKIIKGNSLNCNRLLSDFAGKIQCCVTSPPYYGLRDYQHENQIGLEDTPEEYVTKIVKVFRQVRDVLKNDGTLWLNLGDSYVSHKPRKASHRQSTTIGSQKQAFRASTKARDLRSLYKDKDLLGIPWRVAFALQEDGWYLRQDIIWHKPNPMPESVVDRCTKAHEYIFLLSKSKHYYFDAEAIREPSVTNTRCFGRDLLDSKKSLHHDKQENQSVRNKRSVWTVGNKPFKGAHFAVFPPELIKPCILAGSKQRSIILDPFTGSGTTGYVSLLENRHFVGIELNTDYIQLAKNRLRNIPKRLW